MERRLEPEVMDTWTEASEYDAMDFSQVNQAFADRALELGPSTGHILDAGTGTARIPILIAQKLIAQQRPAWSITGIDLSQNMLIIGEHNLRQAGLTKQIKLELIDAKTMPYNDASFDMVISNSIIHHLPDPIPFWRELKRVLKPHGAIFIRDLLRPQDENTLHHLVDQYAGDCNHHQKQLFADSLQAAFTLAEITEMVTKVGLNEVKVYQSSDRHWSIERAYLCE